MVEATALEGKTEMVCISGAHKEDYMVAAVVAVYRARV
jgi:hypothetical protein